MKVTTPGPVISFADFFIGTGVTDNSEEGVHNLKKTSSILELRIHYREQTRKNLRDTCLDIPNFVWRDREREERKIDGQRDVSRAGKRKRRGEREKMLL